MEITNEGSERESLEDGSYNARCISITDLGTQDSKNPKFKAARRISVGFQAVDEQTEGGEAMVVYRKFPLSFGKKSHLGKALKSWLGVEVKSGESYDLDELLDKECLLTIVNTEPDSEGKSYCNIETIGKPPKGVKVKKATEEIFSFWLDPSQPLDTERFDTLPDFVQEQIAQSDEYKDLLASSRKAKPAKAVASKPVAKKGKR